jgi:anti-anti-sigma factor
MSFLCVVRNSQTQEGLMETRSTTPQRPAAPVQRPPVPASLRLKFEGGEGLPLRAIVRGEVDYEKAFSMQVRIAAACRQRRARGLIVDLTGAEFLSSSAWGAIVNLQQESACMRGGLVLCGATAEVRRILKLTGLDQRLTVVDTPEQAKDLLLYTAAGADTTPSRRPCWTRLGYG